MCGIELERLVGGFLDAGRGLNLFLAALERKHLSVSDGRRKLRFRIIRRQRGGAFPIPERDAGEPELLLARGGIGHEVAILPGNPREKTPVLRVELLGPQITFERLPGLEFLIILIARLNQLERRLGGCRLGGAWADVDWAGTAWARPAIVVRTSVVATEHAFRELENNMAWLVGAVTPQTSNQWTWNDVRERHLGGLNSIRDPAAAASERHLKST